MRLGCTVLGGLIVGAVLGMTAFIVVARLLSNYAGGSPG